MSEAGSGSRSGGPAGSWGSIARPNVVSLAAVMTRTGWLLTWLSWPAAMVVTATGGSRPCCATPVGW